MRRDLTAGVQESSAARRHPKPVLVRGILILESLGASRSLGGAWVVINGVISRVTYTYKPYFAGLCKPTSNYP